MDVEQGLLEKHMRKTELFLIDVMLLLGIVVFFFAILFFSLVFVEVLCESFPQLRRYQTKAKRQYRELWATLVPASMDKVPWLIVAIVFSLALIGWFYKLLGGNPFGVYP